MFSMVAQRVSVKTGVFESNHRDAKDGDASDRQASAICEGVYMSSASVSREARTRFTAVS